MSANSFDAAAGIIARSCGKSPGAPNHHGLFKLVLRASRRDYHDIPRFCATLVEYKEENGVDVFVRSFSNPFVVNSAEEALRAAIKQLAEYEADRALVLSGWTEVDE